ncbi:MULTISPECIES: beta-aspartyl-peptidase [Priestia]|uniref:beta-aspartyl-peptidase n=1 Tax=Priestia TaxID=2800373 RepID=UPI001128739B|nr:MULTISPECIES: beta-aspartyl-peptidase [Priestia]MBU8853535.1 beta-aspartyl-peptidase [Bacillus sp. FJAT-26377]QDZ81244.1 beta-aspartyl-peptidase [Priestia megaterium]TPF18275.1 beta-aspartyl-peptidase [Priestia megaterium]TPF22383.1 beta-aspartyl-peptidase [Priestia megaterium]WDW10531.1 beta-aspartyl-peptidase [Priestia aryabhattai]
MLTLIKNAEVYAPQHLGKKDILLADSKIILIKDCIDHVNTSIPIDVVDAANHIIAPGFIDSHVHIIGGGGEGGYKTRTPELMLTDATTAGVTTIVGVLGTDGTTRRMENLLAKARGLEEEGISCFIHTGSYQIPVKTLTNSIEEDLILIDKIIGVGEIAISDHRSSEPTFEELVKVATAARNGGILSGKAGTLEIHVGDGERKLSLLNQIADKTDLPIRQFHPTHINRNEELFKEGIQFAKRGGYVDFTTSTIPHFLEEGEVKCSKGLRIMLEEKVAIDSITFSSDGNASLPFFDDNGDYKGLQVGKVSSLFQEVRDAVLEESVPLETALQVITSNPAKVLKLSNKGHIQPGKDADLVLLNKETLTIKTVFAQGKVMVKDGVPVVKGTFE